MNIKNKVYNSIPLTAYCLHYTSNMSEHSAWEGRVDRNLHALN